VIICDLEVSFLRLDKRLSYLLCQFLEILFLCGIKENLEEGLRNEEEDVL
jgi:hypothetical protein